MLWSPCLQPFGSVPVCHYNAPPNPSPVNIKVVQHTCALQHTRRGCRASTRGSSAGSGAGPPPQGTPCTGPQRRLHTAPHAPAQPPQAVGPRAWPAPQGTSSTASWRRPMQSTVRCTVLMYRSFFWPRHVVGAHDAHLGARLHLRARRPGRAAASARASNQTSPGRVFRGRRSPMSRGLACCPPRPPLQSQAQHAHRRSYRHWSCALASQQQTASPTTCFCVS